MSSGNPCGIKPRFTRRVRRGLLTIERFIAQTPWMEAGLRREAKLDLIAARRWIADRAMREPLRLDEAAVERQAKRTREWWAKRKAATP